jgi:TPR repeat protein
METAMTQAATFEVQTFDGHGWVTRHRGDDIDAAGEAARRILPEAKRHAVRIVKQSYDPEARALNSQVVFALGKPRRQGLRRLIGAGAALALGAAAIVGAAVVPTVPPDRLADLVPVAVVADAEASAAPIAIADAAEPAPPPPVIPAAGNGFDCRREAAAGLVRPTNLPAERDRLYQLCAAAVDGDPAAQTELAARLAAGTGATADPAQAVLWLQDAARAGHAAAYRPLADLLIAGDDPARAVAWYHRAATEGDIEAAVMLADRYRNGDGVAHDPRVALSYELMAAEAGDAGAMLRVAQAFAAGDGTSPSPEAAQRWLDRAAAAGAAVATATPGLQWSEPLSGDAIPQATWSAPSVATTLSLPPLQLDVDQDAQEAFTAFVAGPQASV